MNNLGWSIVFDQSWVREYRARLASAKIWRVVLILVAILGVAALGMYIATSHQQENFWQIWNQKSGWLVIFYVTLLVDMFLIYDVIEGRIRANKVNWLVKKMEKNPGKEIDVATGLSDESMEILIQTYQQLMKENQSNSQQIGILRFFAQCIASPYFSDLGARLNLDLPKLQEILARQVQQEQAALQSPAVANGATGKYPLSEDLKVALINAFSVAVQNGSSEVDLATIVMALYEQSPMLREIFFTLEVDEAEFYGCLNWLKIDDLLKQRQQHYRSAAKLKATGDMNSTYTAGATPVLNAYGVDLTIEAKNEELPLCVGRDQELENIMNAFSSGQNGVILVGPAKVGKKNVVEGLAQLMVEEKVPGVLRDKRLVALDVVGIVGQADSVMARKILTYIMKEVNEAGNVILFINDINVVLNENIEVGQSGGAGFDLSAILVNSMKNKENYLIATCQDVAYERYVEKQPLGQTMMRIQVDEPAAEKAILMLQTKTLGLEEKYNFRFSYDSLAAAVEMSERYVAEKKLPQKAIEVIELAAVKTSQRCSGEGKRGAACVCNAADVAEVMSETTQIPLQKLTASESEKLINLETELHQYVIGQDEAVDAVAKALRRARTDLQQNRSQPLASFLFLGPTGVGKTELCKTMAKTYFGAEEDMVRLDMSEYQLNSDVMKMIGDPRGTLGYLTEAVRKKPYSLVLFDEIEKAHPDILNLFLQVLDDGRLTNAQGQTISFANTIIVATSNVGANFIQQAVREGVADVDVKAKLMNELLFEKFRPEFINRFDDVIVFKPLSIDDLVKIVSLIVEKVRLNLMEKGIGLEAGEGAMRSIARESYDPQYGARPVRRFVKDRIESQIALLILEGKVERRDTIVIEENLQLRVQKAASL